VSSPDLFRAAAGGGQFYRLSSMIEPSRLAVRNSSAAAVTTPVHATKSEPATPFHSSTAQGYYDNSIIIIIIIIINA